ncbi:MAG TPA: alpha/beta hydrolase [Candidatus Stackebrandtia faecavium]|nr:alpha/beta hydrolase [Candidatus Stackebrandtia faecavium]
MTAHHLTVPNGDVDIDVTDCGGQGPPVILLHGLAGSSRELLATAAAITDSYRVLLIDQRGHGRSTRRPADLSREAFVSDVATVITRLLPGQRATLVGQSMGAHTAFLTAATHPRHVSRLVMLEGHVAGDERTEPAQDVGKYFASWPAHFTDTAHARAILGDSPLTEAWIDDFIDEAEGLRPRFDADIMYRAIAAVHEPRWQEWKRLDTPTLAIFAEHGMFSDGAKAELIRQRPSTRRVDLVGASHDAHLDAFDAWINALRAHLDDEDFGPAAE